MITVEEAERSMMEHVPQLPHMRCTLAEANGCYLFSDVIAPYDHPLFDMSAVDGYAFAMVDGVKEWSVVGEVAAGEVFTPILSVGQCVRIFTGAMVPSGADTVVMQEHVERTGDRIVHRDGKLVRGGNVRRRAEQIPQGAVVLRKGERLSAAAIGLCASVGVRSVKVIPGCRVCVIVTGGEFNEGEALRPGKIFGSNAEMLEVALPQVGGVVRTTHVIDDQVLLEEALREGFANADVVISTGGASVGDHDLVRAAIEAIGGVVHFHGVKQKPGKPLLFATVGGKPFFGLPGNPRAVMVLFHAYVAPFLRAVQGAAHPSVGKDQLPLTHAVELHADRAEYRAARVHGGKVTLLADEGSHMLRSLVEADALAYFPAHVRNWQVGDLVDVQLLLR